jgi:hypothetical protein
MGRVGFRPPLQFGGVQEAITALAPTADAEAVPTLPKTVPVFDLVAVTETGFEEVQVSGTPVSVMPMLSITVALSVVDVPVFTTNDLAGFPTALREIDCTGQVVNCTG